MKWFLLALVLTSCHALASTVTSTKITEVLAGPNYGNRVFLTLEKKPSSKPSCLTNPVHTYVFDASTDVGKTTLSMVLTAYASQTEVRVSGDDSCSLWSNVETLRYVYLK